MPEKEEFNFDEIAKTPSRKESFFERRFEVIHYPGAWDDLSFPLTFFEADTYILSDLKRTNVDFCAEKIKKLGYEVVNTAQLDDGKNWEIEFRKQVVNRGTGQQTGQYENESRKIKYLGESDILDAIPQEVGKNDLVILKGFFPLTGTISSDKAEKFLERIPEGGSIFTSDAEPFKYHFFGLEIDSPENPADYKKKRELTSDEFQRAFRLNAIVRELHNLRGLVQVGRATEETHSAIKSLLSQIDEIKKSYNPEDQELIESVVKIFR